MNGKLLIPLLSIQTSLLVACEPQEQVPNANLDPAQLIIDSPRQEQRWQKKVDGKKQYQRNQWKKCPHLPDRDHTQATQYKADLQKGDYMYLLAQQIEKIKAQQAAATVQQ